MRQPSSASRPMGFRPGIMKRSKDSRRISIRHLNFPAQLTDKAHPGGGDGLAGNGKPADRSKSPIFEISRKMHQDLAAARTHHADNGPRLSLILDDSLRRQMTS